jgi:metal-responsive CopG/Arc/MetJ family transcriptional regulator
MRKTVTLSVPEDFYKLLNSASKRRGLSRSQMALDLMRKQLILDDLHEVQDRMTKRARALAIYTDEDVFERLGIRHAL